MTAPQRVNPARIRKANQARLVAAVALCVNLAASFMLLAGLLAHLDVIADRWQVLAPAGVIVLMVAFPISLAAGQLADRYRQPAGGDQ
ncbi:hypothetical protein [Micromonospora sp. NPDC005174]|uniref:hypothetical protein n=1 Tax=Micromonospora sp. NPDC005174 TaxID=3157018 RepID=UPI0033AD2E19